MIRPVRPNAGLTAAYRKRLYALIDAMHRSAMRWIIAEYRRQEPRIVGDESPAKSLAEAIRRRRKQWQALFNDKADDLAGWFIGKVDVSTTNAARESLKPVLPTVKFNPSRVYNATMQAHIQENVALIKSIPEQYASQVEAAVMRSVAAGGDMKALTDELEQRYNITRKRAAFIAKDQNTKATSQLNAARQTGVGIEFGEWRHSGAGKHPRPKHKKADRKIFRIAKGMKIEGKWILPGEEINCRCVWLAKIAGVDYPVGGVPKGFKEEYLELQ